MRHFACFRCLAFKPADHRPLEGARPCNSLDRWLMPGWIDLPSIPPLCVIVCRRASHVACRAPTTPFTGPSQSRPCHEVWRTEEGGRSVPAQPCSLGFVRVCRAHACAHHAQHSDGEAIPVWERGPGARAANAARGVRKGRPRRIPLFRSC